MLKTQIFSFCGVRGGGGGHGEVVLFLYQVEKYIHFVSGYVAHWGCSPLTSRQHYVVINSVHAASSVSYDCVPNRFLFCALLELSAQRGGNQGCGQGVGAGVLCS